MDTNGGSWHFLTFLWNSASDENGKFIRRERPLVPRMRVSFRSTCFIPIPGKMWNSNGDIFPFFLVICEATKCNRPPVLWRFDHFAIQPCRSVQLLCLETVDLMEWVWMPGENFASTVKSLAKIQCLWKGYSQCVEIVESVCTALVLLLLPHAAQWTLWGVVPTVALPRGSVNDP